MANLSINLLPQEMTAAKQQRHKVTFIIQMCVVGLVILIVAAGIILSFRFAQSAQLTKLESQSSDVKQKINSPENSKREGLVVTLKSRLDSLNQINNQSYPASYAFGMISKMIPPNTKLVALTTDTKGKTLIQIEAPDTATLDLFLNNLMDPQQNQQKVTSASVQSIALSKNNVYSAGVELVLAGGAK